jgi:hypothetical protein
MFDFLKLLLADWRGRMSGSVGLILTLVGFLVEQKWAKWLFFIAGIFTFLYGSYYVWSKERNALNTKQAELDKEKAKSARPDIAVEIQEVYPEFAISQTGKHPYYIDEYYSIKVHLVNKGRQIAIRRFELYANTEKGVMPCQPTTLEYLALEREQRLTPKWGVHYSKIETVQETLSDLSKDKSLITHGDNREGWLRFVLPEISNEQLSEVTGITLWVVDAESNAHKMTINKPQWRQSGNLVNTYRQEFQRELQELKKNEPDIECEIKEVQEFSGTSNIDFDYFFTLNVFLRSKGRVAGIRDYSFRMIQGNHTYPGERSSLRGYCVERKEPHPGRGYEGTEMKAVEYPLIDMWDLNNVPLDRSGRDGWLRFVVRGVRFFEDEWEEGGEVRIPKKVELTIFADDGTKYILESSQPFQAKSEIRKCTNAH